MDDMEKKVVVPSLIKTGDSASTIDSPPRSSDSDWSDIDTDEQSCGTDCDEEAAGRLRIDTSEKSQRKNNSINVTENQNEEQLCSKQGTAQLSSTLQEQYGSTSQTDIKQ